MSDEIQFQKVELIIQARVHFQIIAVERYINLDVNESFEWDRFNRFLESSRASLKTFHKSTNDIQDIEDIYKNVDSVVSQYQALTEDAIEKEMEEEETECLEEETEDGQDSQVEQEDSAAKGEGTQQANKVNGAEKGKSRTKMSTKLLFKSAPTGNRHSPRSETNGRKVELKKPSNKYSRHQKATDVNRPNKTTTNNYHESWYSISQNDTGYEYNSKRSILVTGVPMMIRDPIWLSQLFKEQSYCREKDMFIATRTYIPHVKNVSQKQEPLQTKC